MEQKHYNRENGRSDAYNERMELAVKKERRGMKKKENRIAIYSRKSKFTGKGESIGNQVELCRDYVCNMFGEEYRDWCVVFEDEGFSGGNLKRPAFQKMMAEVRNHQFKAIVVYRLDRISRNISDFTGLIDELTKLDVSFVSIREQFDTSTPMGRAMMFIISVFSQLERETIAERIRDNMHELAKTGRWLGGNAPLGYRSEGVTKVAVDGKARRSFMLVPVAEEISIPKMIFDLYTEMDSLTAVEAEMLRRRIKTRQGKDFTRFAIKSILQNPVYMVADGDAYNYFVDQEADVCYPKEAFDGSFGIMAYNRTDQEKGRSMILLPVTQWIIAIGKHSGIIPAKQWIKVQESLDRNKSKAYRKARSNEALLTGLLFCSCGERMYPKLSKNRTPEGEVTYTYVCKMKERSKRQRCSSRNVHGNVLDEAIIEQIKGLTESGGDFLTQLEQCRRQAAGHSGSCETQLTELRARHAQNERAVNGLIDSLGMLEASAARPRVLKRMEELSAENNDIEKRIRELEGIVTANSLNDVEFDRLKQMLCVFCRCVNEMSVEEQRAAVRDVVHKVIWDGERAHVVLFGADAGEICLPEIERLYADTMTGDHEQQVCGTHSGGVCKTPLGEGSK